jgi:hypothetical protein
MRVASQQQQLAIKLQLRRNLQDAVRVLSRAHTRDRARTSPVSPGRENRGRRAKMPKDKSAHRRRRNNLNPADPKIVCVIRAPVLYLPAALRPCRALKKIAQ